MTVYPQPHLQIKNAKQFFPQETLCGALSHFSLVQLFVIPWTIARQAPLSMGILQARMLEWIAMPSSRGFLDPGIEPVSLASPALQADSLPDKSWGKPIAIKDFCKANTYVFQK